MPRKPKTYKGTVMLRITTPLIDRLDRAAGALSEREREQGRARKVGRATIVYEAMLRGLPLLEADVGTEPAQEESES